MIFALSRRTASLGCTLLPTLDLLHHLLKAPPFPFRRPRSATTKQTPTTAASSEPYHNAASRRPLHNTAKRLARTSALHPDRVYKGQPLDPVHPPSARVHPQCGARHSDQSFPRILCIGKPRSTQVVGGPQIPTGRPTCAGEDERDIQAV